MKRYDRTWPLSVAAMAVGGFVGWALFGPGHVHFGSQHHHVSELVGVDHPAAVEGAPVLVDFRAPRRLERLGVARLAGLSTEGVLEVLRSGQAYEDRRAAAALLATRGRDASMILGALMIAARTDAHEAVRAKAAESLGWLGAEDALGSLHLAARHDGSPQVREAAVKAMRTIGHVSSLPVLLDVLGKDASPRVREQARLAMTEIRDKQVRSVAGN